MRQMNLKVENICDISHCQNKNFYAVLNVNDRCMDFDCRCNRVKFMDGFVVFQEHTNENDVTLAIIPKENILFIATE